MIVTARRNHRRCAVVLDTTRVRVDAVMQLRRSTQRKRPEKCRRNASRNKCTPAICRTRERAHCAATFWLRFILRKKFLQNVHYLMIMHFRFFNVAKNLLLLFFWRQLSSFLQLVTNRSLIEIYI